MQWQKTISVDPMICHGRPCFVGTRILVSVVLDNLAAGQSREQVLASYPSLADHHLDAALAYAAELARERVVSIADDALPIGLG